MLTNHTVQTYAHKLRMVTPKAFMVRMIETRSWELMAQLIHMGEVELVDLGLPSQACWYGLVDSGLSSQACRLGLVDLSLSTWACRLELVDLGLSTWAWRLGLVDLGLSTWACWLGLVDAKISYQKGLETFLIWKSWNGSFYKDQHILTLSKPFLVRPHANYEAISNIPFRLNYWPYV